MSKPNEQGVWWKWGNLVEKESKIGREHRREGRAHSGNARERESVCEGKKKKKHSLLLRRNCEETSMDKGRGKRCWNQWMIL